MFIRLLLVLLSCRASFAQVREIDAIFAGYHASTPGVAVAVMAEGKVIFQRGYGSANLEQAIPVTERTVFQLGSVSKQFTAFAIYLLEKQGKLSLEDDVRKYVSELPDFGHVVRIKHVLAHTSGLRDQLAILTLAGWRMDDVMTSAEALRMIVRQKELNFAPGSRYLYSNAGYVLAAEIVKRVSGSSLAEFTRQNIFRPLKMNDTQFGDDYEAIVKNRADSYHQENGVYKRTILSDSIVGPSNLYTTVGDMAKWAWNFENPVVGDRELIRRFNEPSLLNNGERAVFYADPGDIGYHAKGQIVRQYRRLDVISHGGHAGGFRSTFWRFPSQRFAVVLLSNDEHFAQLRKAEAVIDHFLKDVLKAKQNVEQPAPVTARPAEGVQSALGDFEGRYYSKELDAAYTARVVNGKLVLAHLRHGDITLAESGKDAFTGRIQFPVRLAFQRDAAGRVVALHISNFGALDVPFHKTPVS